MRTTLTLDDELVHELRRIAMRTRRPFKKVVDETIRLGLATARKQSPAARRYRLKPTSLGGPMPGVDLTKALAIADALEDEAIIRKMEHRK